MEQAQQQEQLRQQYLAAMGVTAWLPVRALPGAAASPVWHWSSRDEPAVRPRPAVQPQPHTQLPPQQEPSVAKPARADIRQLLADPSLRSEAPPPARPAAEPPAAPAEPEAAPSVVESPSRSRAPVPRFRLALIRYSDCLVVDELPLQSLQGFSPAHRALLARILASVGLGGSEPRVEAFAWPLVNAPHVDQGESVARGGLKTVLWRAQQGAVLPLLLLGETAAHYVLDPELPRTPGSWCDSGDAPWSLVSHSLGELLKVPGRKQELWQHLLPLRSRP